MTDYASNCYERRIIRMRREIKKGRKGRMRRNGKKEKNVEQKAKD